MANGDMHSDRMAADLSQISNLSAVGHAFTAGCPCVLPVQLEPKEPVQPAKQRTESIPWNCRLPNIHSSSTTKTATYNKM